VRRGLVALVLLLGGLVVVPASAVTLPTVTQQQVDADRPVPVPATAVCRMTIMQHDFASSYGAPFVGTYKPTCHGPWSEVVQTLTSTVSGDQYDRDVYIAIGHSVLLDGSTSEPCCTGNAVTWTVQRDITPYIPVLTKAQPVMVELDNVTNSTYTGVYDTTVSLAFYAVGAHAPAGIHPDVILPVSSPSRSTPMLTISKDGQTVGQSVVFPRNLVRLEGELYADGHGPCEEFWWTDPSNCAGTPYREVAVLVDGRLAGAAPTYPVTYTGADGPGLWEPIPSPRAWDLRPYDVDLTPFVALLTDGAPHRIQLSILDSSLASGDFWEVAANLWGWVDPGRAVTTGRLTVDQAPASPSNATGATSAAVYSYSASHVLSYTGWVATSEGVVGTSVHETMGEQAIQEQVVDQGSWTWDSVVQTTGGTSPGSAEVSSTYSAFTSALTSFVFSDANTTTTTPRGGKPTWSSFDETMRTAAPTGIVFNGAESERYGYSDSTGLCYDHRLGSAAGEVVLDESDGFCPSAPG